jgi:hypothetical protein
MERLLHGPLKRMMKKATTATASLRQDSSPPIDKNVVYASAVAVVMPRSLSSPCPEPGNQDKPQDTSAQKATAIFPAKTTSASHQLARSPSNPAGGLNLRRPRMTDKGHNSLAWLLSLLIWMLIG